MRRTAPRQRTSLRSRRISVQLFKLHDLHFLDQRAEEVCGPNLYGLAIQQKRQDVFASTLDVQILHGFSNHLMKHVRAQPAFRRVVTGLAHSLFQVA